VDSGRIFGVQEYGRNWELNLEVGDRGLSFFWIMVIVECVGSLQDK
jgi:hypothetical protein